MSEEKLCRVLKQDLILLCVGMLLFASGLYLMLGEATFVLMLVGAALMVAVSFDVLKVSLFEK